MRRALPLHGIKVIELSGLAVAPFCGSILADWGADVVRVDRPARERQPMLRLGREALGRHKRSCALDLSDPGAVDALRALARTADVLIEPFRPGVMERLGLGPDELLAEVASHVRAAARARERRRP